MIVVCAVQTTFHRFTNQIRTGIEMLFCPSFTQFERFLQTDQLIIRLQVVVVTNCIRMLMRNVFVNVFKSDAVIWWAAIFRREEGKEGGFRWEGLGVWGCFRPFAPEYHWILPLSFWLRTAREQHVPDSSNHSPKMIRC